MFNLWLVIKYTATLRRIMGDKEITYPLHPLYYDLVYLTLLTGG